MNEVVSGFINRAEKRSDELRSLMAIANRNDFNLRDELNQLGMTQSGLARYMQELGDPRPFKGILRTIQRMIAGHVRVSGEMQALIGLIKRVRS